jgi:hypothetical protein
VAPDLPKLPVVSPFDRWDGVPILNTGSFFGWDEPRKSQHEGQDEGQKMGGLGRSNTAWGEENGDAWSFQHSMGGRLRGRR